MVDNATNFDADHCVKKHVPKRLLAESIIVPRKVVHFEGDRTCKECIERQRLHSALGYRSPEEFERQAKDADSMAQLSSPKLEFFPGTENRISTRMLEDGTQTPSPPPDLLPG